MVGIFSHSSAYLGGKDFSFFEYSMSAAAPAPGAETDRCRIGVGSDNQSYVNLELLITINSVIPTDLADYPLKIVA